jgi:hypothetical protein
VQEVLVDGGELTREDLVQEIDDFRIAFHAVNAAPESARCKDKT